MLKNEKEQLSIPLLEIIQAAQQGAVVHREGLQDLQRLHLAGVHFQQIRSAPGAPGLGYNITVCSPQIFNNFAFTSHIPYAVHQSFVQLSLPTCDV